MDLAGTLQSVVTALAGITGVETASTDPAAIIAPGVWVRLRSIDKDTLTGRSVTLDLFLLVADTDGGPGPAAALSTLLTAVETWAQADGPIQAVTVALPSNPTPLPGLVFPLIVRTEA